MLRVGGSDRTRFLQSQLTSDVSGLAVGEAHLSALLTAGGRVSGFLLLARADDAVVLAVPGGCFDAVRAALDAHVIGDDVSLDEVPTSAPRLALGPCAEAALGGAPAAGQARLTVLGARGFMVWDSRKIDIPELSAEEVERRCVLAGFPRWGVDVVAGALVNETVLMLEAVSQSKGCYLGQETVAKLESRRGAAYGPALLIIEQDTEVAPAGLVGEAFEIEGRRGGTVVAHSDWEGRPVLQVSLFRGFRVRDRALSCHFAEVGPVTTRVASPPLLKAPTARENADELYHRAVADFTAGREDEAVRRLELAIVVSPGHADAYESLGVILGRRGEYERAIEKMKKLLEIDPASVMAHTNLSLFYNRLGHIEDAEREQVEAARAAMRRQQSEQERAEANRRAAEEAEAERRRRREMFEQVLGLDSDDPLASFGLGKLLVEEGRFAEAVGRLEHVLEVSPGHSAAYLALGQAYEGTGAPERARGAYVRGVEVAAHAGDLMTANAMQERIARLDR